MSDYQGPISSGGMQAQSSNAAKLSRIEDDVARIQRAVASIQNAKGRLLRYTRHLGYLPELNAGEGKSTGAITPIAPTLVNSLGDLELAVNQLQETLGLFE